MAIQCFYASDPTLCVFTRCLILTTHLILEVIEIIPHLIGKRRLREIKQTVHGWIAGGDHCQDLNLSPFGSRALSITLSCQ